MTMTEVMSIVNIALRVLNGNKIETPLQTKKLHCAGILTSYIRKAHQKIPRFARMTNRRDEGAGKC